MIFKTLSIVAVLASVALGQVAVAYSSVITEEIVTFLNKNGKADIIVELKAGVSKAQDSIKNLKFATRGAKITTLREALIENAAESQKSVLAILNESFGVDSSNVQTFWISNVVYATDVPKDAILKLAGLAEVAVIRAPVDVPLDGVVTSKRVIEPQQEQSQWGVSITKADQVWDYGIRGEGIVVASVDTGVRVTHRILRENYRGEYGWLDPATRSASPRDFDGHGTHTMGTIAAMKELPKFGEPIPNVTVAVGRDASLPCVVENLGNHKVAWVHIDRRMILTIHRHIVTKIPRFSVSYDSHKTWLLHINSVQQEDRGYYMCQVNTEPMISQVGYLQVVVPPNIMDDDSSESHVTVREHQNITLNCKAEGFPEPRITWKREDGHPFAVDRRKKVNVSEGERLHLFKISRLEMGAYLCIASNGVPPSVSKRIIVDVEFSPMIWVPNQLVGAPKGTNVTLECHTEAFPRAISYWVYENTMILTGVKHHTEIVENNFRTHMRLTVKDLKDRDFGKYKCLSKNSLGETEGSIRLYEIPLPSVPPRATEVKNKNEPVGVVRLTHAGKTDEGGRTKEKGDDKKGRTNRVSTDGSSWSNNGQSSGGGGSIRAPPMDTPTDSAAAGSVCGWSHGRTLSWRATLTYLTPLIAALLGWKFIHFSSRVL